MNPLERYQHDVDYGAIQADEQQKNVVQHMQRLHQALQQRQQQCAHPCYRLKAFLFKKHKHAIPGLYLWGGVGIGKTYLMDLFYQSLSFAEKKRYHFHHFMHIIHQQLHERRDQVNPLPMLAKRWAKETHVLCLDEFMVLEITDAMILAQLLHAFFQEGITIVTTSNVAPDDLYANGLQRERFLPTIAHLHQYTQVCHLASHVDYRCQNLAQQGVYFYPMNRQTSAQMRQIFAQLKGEAIEQEKTITIAGRSIPAQHIASDIIWFDFDVLCQIPRNQHDYLFIAREFHTVFLSGVPAIPANQIDIATNFIHLVDILYDAKVKLIIQAAVKIDAIYPQGRLQKTFQRTQSRLMEMQSEQYLHEPHVLLVERGKIV